MRYNQLESFSFKNCPKYLQKLDLHFNDIKEFLWESATNSLSYLNISDNKLMSFDFKNCPDIYYTKIIIDNHLNINFENVPSCIEIINPLIKINDITSHKKYNKYKKTLNFYKEQARKLRPITDTILHFHMQPPKINAGASALQKRGGILFHQDYETLQQLLKDIIHY